MSGLLLTGAEVRSQPFLHATVNEVFTPEVAEELRAELASMGTWQLHRGDFFEQYEQDLLQHGPPRVRQLLSTELLGAVRNWVGDVLMTAFEDRFKVIAHRLVPGQGIGLHNDAPDDETETHRFVVHLGDNGYQDDRGGHLILFDKPDISTVSRVFRPLHNMGMAFAASPDSFHAVSPVRHGMRSSVVFSFWESRADHLLVDADQIAHSGGTLRQHLDGVGALLQQWELPAPVVAAGRLHSIYGTEHFGDPQGQPDAASRATMSAAVGEDVERLVWLYSISSRDSRVASLRGGCLRDYRSDQELTATTSERMALVQIDLADTVEQLPRVPVDSHELKVEWDRFSSLAEHLPESGLEALRRVIEERS